MTDSKTHRLVQRFAEHELPHAEWTHEAHLRVGLWHVLRFPADEALDRLRTGIRTYNVACGSGNSETEGYHETITRLYVVLLRHFVETHDREQPVDELADRVVELLGDREEPLPRRWRLRSPVRSSRS